MLGRGSASGLLLRYIGVELEGFQSEGFPVFRLIVLLFCARRFLPGLGEPVHLVGVRIATWDRTHHVQRRRTGL